MRAKHGLLGGREFAVRIEIELPTPLLTRHAALLLASAAAGCARLSGRETGGTSPSQRECQESRKFPDKTFPPLRTAAISRENVPATRPAPAAPSRDSRPRSECSPASRSPPEECFRSLPRPAARRSSV